MPTNQRVQATAVEISDQLGRLGYEIINFHGPVGEDGEEISGSEIENSPEENISYFLVAEGADVSFYIVLQTNRDYGQIVYPLDLISYLARGLDENEVSALATERLDEGSKDENQSGHEAIYAIIENTPPQVIDLVSFRLYMYASTALVRHQQTHTDDGFPMKYQSTRGILPYTQNISLQYLDENVFPVLVAGERGRRYIDYSLRMKTDGKNPEEYELTTML